LVATLSLAIGTAERLPRCSACGVSIDLMWVWKSGDRLMIRADHHGEREVVSFGEEDIAGCMRTKAPLWVPFASAAAQDLARLAIEDAALAAAGAK